MTPLAVPPPRVRRIVYLGTPEIAVPPLQALHAAGFDVVLVITAPDKRRGRGSKLVPTPVKLAALELGIPVSHSIEDAIAVDADLGVVVAFGQLIKEPILAKLAMVNIHFSLLPRWRGAAPVERAILAGDPETGVCLMELALGLDTGGVYRRQTFAIDDDASLEELWASLVAIGSEVLVDALTAGLGTPEPQSGEPTYAKKLTSEEFRLDFAESAAALHRRVRVGRAWCEFRGKRLRVWATKVDASRDDLAAGQLDGDWVGTGNGALQLITVQPEGKAKMDATAWRNGAQPGPDEQLS